MSLLLPPRDLKSLFLPQYLAAVPRVPMTPNTYQCERWLLVGVLNIAKPKSNIRYILRLKLLPTYAQNLCILFASHVFKTGENVAQGHTKPCE